MTTTEAIRTMSVRRGRPKPEKIIAIASPIVVLVLWELFARTGVFDARILPPPSAVAVRIFEMLTQQNLLNDIGSTIVRFLSGLALGAIPGTIIGMLMGLNRWFRAALAPLVKVFYPIPHIALFPLVLILSGLNERSNLILVALGPFFTMLIVSSTAVTNLAGIHLDVGRSFRETRLGTYRRIVFPGTLPELFGGLRVALGQGLVGAVAVEFLTGATGLGSVIWKSWQILSLSTSMAGLVCVALLGGLAFLLLDAIERAALPWHPRRDRR